MTTKTVDVQYSGWVSCPQCHRPIKATRADVGKEVACPHCRFLIAITDQPVSRRAPIKLNTIKETDAAIEYSGWAPCCHTRTEEAKFRTWLAEIIGDDPLPEEPHYRGALECLLWELADMGATPTLVCDQWRSPASQSRPQSRATRFCCRRPRASGGD